MSDIYRLHKLRLQAPAEFLFVALAGAVPGMSRGQARDAVMAGLVRVDGEVVETPKRVLGEGTHAVEADLRQGIKRAAAAARAADGRGADGPAALVARPFTVLYEDAHVVVVDKATGVLSAPLGRIDSGRMDSGQIDGEGPARGHVPELLRRMWRKRGRAVSFVGVVHRLDKETSGCLAFALTRDAQRNLAAQFACHSAGRTYRCLTDGAPPRDEMTLTGVIGHGPDGRRCFRFDPTAADRLAGRLADRAHETSSDDPYDVYDDDRRRTSAAPPKRAFVPRGSAPENREPERRAIPGRDAVTHLKVLRRMRRGADLEVTLETGRTHQIRVSLLAIGCPVSGDHVYFDRGAAPGHKTRAPRMMLHAASLAFDHPANGRRIEVVAPLPDAFATHARVLDSNGSR